MPDAPFLVMILKALLETDEAKREKIIGTN